MPREHQLNYNRQRCIHCECTREQIEDGEPCCRNDERDRRIAMQQLIAACAQGPQLSDHSN
jgi:hypothetical protein